MLAVCLVEVAKCEMAGTARRGCPRARDGDKDGDSPFGAFSQGRSRFPSQWALAAPAGKAELLLLHETIVISL